MTAKLSPLPTGAAVTADRLLSATLTGWLQQLQQAFVELQGIVMTQPVVLVAAQYLTASIATYYTAPVGPGNAGSGGSTPVVSAVWVDRATLNNTDTVARTVSIYVVASGGSASNANAVVLTFSLAAGATYEVEELYGVLTAGQTVQAAAAVASKIVFRVTGELVT